MNKTVLIIIVASAVIFGGYLLFRGGYQAPQELGVPVPGQQGVLETEVLASENSVLANDQKQGSSVIIASVQLTEPGYVVVHEDENGQPGPVIGNSNLLEQGTNVVITLKRETRVGETLYGMLHRDDGDGVYEFPGDDLPVKDENGKVVLSRFTVTDNVTVAVPSVKQISMVSENFFFNPKNIAFKKGETVKITFQNNGIHTFTIDELGVNVTLQESSPTVEFAPNKSGAFEYYCAIPGHRERGMFGSITVE